MRCGGGIVERYRHPTAHHDLLALRRPRLISELLLLTDIYAAIGPLLDQPADIVLNRLRDPQFARFAGVSVEPTDSTAVEAQMARSRCSANSVRTAAQTVYEIPLPC